MSTNAPAPAAPPDAAKPLDAASQALGLLYTHCATADPSGEACGVVAEMLKGLGAVRQRLVDGPPPAPPTPMIQGGSAFDQAGMDAFQQMQQDPNAAQGPPPGLPGGQY